MIWQVELGSDYVQQQLAGGANPIAVDGPTRQTITVTDTLGPGMAFDSDLSKWGFRLRNSAAEPTMADTVLTNGSGRDLTTKYGDFDMSVEIKGQDAVISITGPFAAQSNYKIVYPVTFTSASGKATVGVRYTNAATLNDSGARSEFTRSYTDSFKTTVQMAAGFGGFEVSKSLGGTGVDAVDVANTTLPVKVDYTLPAPASTYTGWQAPGTLNADGTTGSTTLDVAIGRTTTFQGTFPQGAVVTLTEDTAKASPAPAGYTWGEPAFTVGGAATNTLTIKDQVSAKVSLDNTAEVFVQNGTFQVAKSVTGTQPAAGAETKDFSFDYTCSDGQSGKAGAKGDGVAVQVGAVFPVGTTCTVTEDTATAAIEGYTLAAPSEATVMIAAPAEPIATATFVNAYTQDPVAPTPSPEPSPEPTQEPSESPSTEPSPEPTATPSPEPSEEPTSEPWASPSPDGSVSPERTPEPTESAQPTGPADPTASSDPTAPADPTASADPATSADPAVPMTAQPAPSSTPQASGSSLARTGAYVLPTAILGAGALAAGLLLIRRRRA